MPTSLLPSPHKYPFTKFPHKCPLTNIPTPTPSHQHPIDHIASPITFINISLLMSSHQCPLTNIPHQYAFAHLPYQHFPTFTPPKQNLADIPLATSPHQRSLINIPSTSPLHSHTNVPKPISPHQCSLNTVSHQCHLTTIPPPVCPDKCSLFPHRHSFIIIPSQISLHHHLFTNIP